MTTVETVSDERLEELLSVACVRDRDAGLRWYAAFFGRAADELIGPGQTHAAAEAIGYGVRHVAHDLPGARHADLFTGPLFLRHLAPALVRFIAEAEP